jgi:hypothetical protein
MTHLTAHARAIRAGRADRGEWSCMASVSAYQPFPYCALCEPFGREPSLASARAVA